jgi:hypothetical protein
LSILADIRPPQPRLRRTSRTFASPVVATDDPRGDSRESIAPGNNLADIRGTKRSVGDDAACRIRTLIADIARVKKADYPMVPAGMVTREDAQRAWVNGQQAREMFAVSSWIWNRWNEQGKILCGQAIGAGRWRLRYPVEELGREIEQLRQAEASVPPGMVAQEEAQRILGVGKWAWTSLEQAGKLRCGQWFAVATGGRRKLYPVEAIQRIGRERSAFPPAGWVDGRGAAKMFGVAPLTWKNWVVQGKVPRGKWFDKPAGSRCYLWEVSQLERLKEEQRGPGSAYADAQRPGHYVVPPNLVTRRDGCRMFGVSMATWKKWQTAGLMRGTRVGCALFYDVEEIRKLLPVYGPIAPPYPDPDRPGVYRLPLTSAGVLAGRPNRREALIDAADLPLAQGKRWGWIGPTERGGLGHVAMSHAQETTALHRIIMGVTDSSLKVMHRNDDPLDCRRENLVLRTKPECSAAARKARTYRGRPCTSRFKGVCWDENKGKWVAQIKAEGVHRLLGRFEDEISAAQAYDEAAVQAWGEHARVNFPNTAAADAAALEDETPQVRDAA